MKTDRPKALDAEAEPCEECGGDTIRFRGRGLNLQWCICSRWQEPGHLTEKEWRDRLREETAAALPSGRWA